MANIQASNKPISGLPAITACQTTDLFATVQDGITYKATDAQLITLLKSTFLALTGGTMTGPLVMTNTSIQTDQTNSHTLTFQAYATARSAYQTLMTMTAGTSFATLAIASSGFGIVTIDNTEIGQTTPTLATFTQGTFTNGIVLANTAYIQTGDTTPEHNFQMGAYSSNVDAVQYAIVFVNGPDALCQLAGGTNLTLTIDDASIGATVPGSGAFTTLTSTSSPAFKNLYLNVSCGVATNATQSIPDASFTAIAFNAEDYKTLASMHNNSTNNSRVTVPYAGIYEVEITVPWQEGSGSGPMQLNLNKNGSTIQTLWREEIEPLENATVVATGWWRGALAANDYLEAVVFQSVNGGSALNTSYYASGTDFDWCRMSVTMISGSTF